MGTVLELSPPSETLNNCHLQETRREKDDDDDLGLV